MMAMPRCFAQPASLALAAVLVASFGTAGQAAAEPLAAAPVPGEFCTNTVKAARNSCEAEAKADYWLEIGLCRNRRSDQQEACGDKARSARNDALEECGDQFRARRKVCNALGEERYAPKIDPADFVRPIDNPYFPHKPGTTRIYRKVGEEGTERVVVTVTGETETILGVKCTVVRDRAWLDGELIEDTIDWFAQDKWGNVWYFGEISKEFENGLLVSLDGSWRAGVDGARPGIVMKAKPRVGDVYRQEFALGEAEDLAEVISRSGNAKVPAASCDDCLVTRDFTPIEPGVFERKFYARGIGAILELDPETGERLELIKVINE